MRCCKFICLFFCAILIIFSVAGCNGSIVTPAQTTNSTSVRTSSVTSPTTPTSSSEDNWPTYNRDLSRSGFDPGVFPSGPLNRLWTSDRLDGDIYAEPLIVGERVLVATEQDSYILSTLRLANSNGM